MVIMNLEKLKRWLNKNIYKVIGKTAAVSYLICVPIYLFSDKQPNKINILVMEILTINYFWNYFGKED